MTGKFYASELELAAPSAQKIELINEVLPEVRHNKQTGQIERAVVYYGFHG